MSNSESSSNTQPLKFFYGDAIKLHAFDLMTRFSFLFSFSVWWSYLSFIFVLLFSLQLGRDNGRKEFTMFEMKNENENWVRCIGMFWVNKIKFICRIKWKKKLCKFLLLFILVNGIHAFVIYYKTNFGTRKNTELQKLKTLENFTKIAKNNKLKTWRRLTVSKLIQMSHNYKRSTFFTFFLEFLLNY